MDATEPGPLRMTDRLGTVQSLARALRILDQLSRARGLSLSEVAAHVALPRSTTHRLLCTMQELKYVQFERLSRRWLIGVQAFNVGMAYAPASKPGRADMSLLAGAAAPMSRHSDSRLGQMVIAGARRVSSRRGSAAAAPQPGAA